MSPLPSETTTTTTEGDVMTDEAHWIVPCSFAQQRLWFLDRFEPGSSAYNLADALRLEGALDLVVLERSFNAVIRRHEALRTTFAQVDEEPVQVVADELELPLPVVDLGALAPELREGEARRRAREEADTGFDLETGPLLRGRVLRLGPEDELPGVMSQWMSWNLEGEWLGEDRIDYAEALGAVRVPVLAVSGAGDTTFAPPEACRRLMEMVGTDDATYILAGRDTGFGEDFDHPGIVVSRVAHQEVWPLVIDWLRGHAPTPARPGQGGLHGA